MSAILLSIAVMLALGLYGFRCERRDWNGGVCRESGRRWHYFDEDSQGGRGYVDDPAWGPDARTIWVSWGVDK